jgi:hypothetical protein
MDFEASHGSQPFNIMGVDAWLSGPLFVLHPIDKNEDQGGQG